MSKQSKIYLKDYQPPTHFITDCELYVDLHEDKTLVTATHKIKKNDDHPQSTSTLELNGAEMKLLSVKLNGESFTDYQEKEDKLILNSLPDSCELQTVVEIHPETNTSCEGLYKSGGKFTTQCEAEGFRKITYFLDRPDNMTRFKTTLAADKKLYPYLLSNGNLVSSKDLDNGRHESSWVDPFKKPCYLFALVAGDFDLAQGQFKTMSHREVQLQVFVDKGKEARAHFAIDCLKRSMKWEEETYGLEYDLDLYMIVATDDFNMGAMENKGLNIFNSSIILADEKTASDKLFERIDAVIGHEYFHNWSGNRVTCRDWFQLSLKEGLTVYRDQEYTSDHYDRSVKRIQDADGMKTRQFKEDAGPQAHPVRPEYCYSVDNFYTSTIYSKGAELIRMMETIVGLDDFKKGLALYFKKHDGQAVTTDDFVACIQEASQYDFTQFKLWYSQSGTPLVKVKKEFHPENQTLTLHFEQSNADSEEQKNKKPQVIPIKLGLLDKQGQDINLRGQTSPMIHRFENTENGEKSVVVVLTESNQSITFNNLTEEPTLSLLRDFSAPVNIDFEQSNETVALLMEKDSNLYNRWSMGKKLFLDTLIEAYKDKKTIQETSVWASLSHAFGQNLASALDAPLFFSEMIQLPSLNQLKLSITAPFNPVELSALHRQLEHQLAQSHQDSLHQLYKQCLQKVSPKFTHNAYEMGLRSLSYTALKLLTRTSHENFIDMALEQYKTADNFTQEQAAFNALIVRTQGKAKEFAKSSFFEKWKNDSSVFLSWLIAQAIQEEPGQASHFIQNLWQQDYFQKTSPNHLRTYSYFFAMNQEESFGPEIKQNLEAFFQAIIETDRNNPIASSGMCSTLSEWKSYSPEIKKDIQAFFEKLNQEKLSDNLLEIVERALKN